MKKKKTKTRRRREFKRNCKIYRKIYEKHIGRKLEGEENIHHIDLDRTNNDISNLHMFKTNELHAVCHRKLEKLITSLIRDGFLTFEDGQYIVNIGKFTCS